MRAKNTITHGVSKQRTDGRADGPNRDEGISMGRGKRPSGGTNRSLSAARGDERSKVLPKVVGNDTAEQYLY